MQLTSKLNRFTLIASISLGCAIGCADGPFFALKRINPYFTTEWQEDSDIAPTYDDRIGEVQILQQQLPAYEPQEQSKWLKSIADIVINDASVELRRQALLALKSIDAPSTYEILAGAAKDPSVKIRLTVAQVLGTLNPSRAISALESLANNDDSTSVRVAAIKSLGNIPTTESYLALGRILDDVSPAIQFQATSSLVAITGKSDLGGNAKAWRSFIAENQQPELNPTGDSFLTNILSSSPR